MYVKMLRVIVEEIKLKEGLGIVGPAHMTNTMKTMLRALMRVHVIRNAATFETTGDLHRLISISRSDPPSRVNRASPVRHLEREGIQWCLLEAWARREETVGEDEGCQETETHSGGEDVQPSDDHHLAPVHGVGETADDKHRLDRPEPSLLGGDISHTACTLVGSPLDDRRRGGLQSQEGIHVHGRHGKTAELAQGGPVAIMQAPLIVTGMVRDGV